MPAITICRPWFVVGDCTTFWRPDQEPIYNHAIDCIEKINNVSKFVDDIKYDNTVKGNQRCHRYI